MTEFVWTSGPEGSNNDQPSEPDSGFAALGLEPVVAPRPESHRADVASGSGVVAHDGAPLTRRELRAREQRELQAREEAALAAAPAPALMSRQVVAPQQPPAMQTAPQQAPAPHMLAPQQPPAPQMTAPRSDVPVATTTSAFVSAQADTVSATTSSKRSRKAPKKPKAQRPVRLPRGTSRPRTPAPASVHPSVSLVQRKPFKRRMLKKLMTLGAMIGAGLMMVSTTIPANAFYPSADMTGEVSAEALAAVPAEAEAKVQTLKVAPVADLSLTRDGYTATSFREQIFLRYGNRNFAYTNNPNGTIQWPFPIAVPISDGFGYRIDPCSFCSPWHKGVDFTPGIGSTIQAIADGTVMEAKPAHWGLGNHVILDHVINGKHIQSVYAHMLDDSMRVVVGQTVKVGDPLGQVGSTGESTGPHLHFEIHVNGEPVDGFEWLKANAN